MQALTAPPFSSSPYRAREDDGFLLCPSFSLFFGRIQFKPYGMRCGRKRFVNDAVLYLDRCLRIDRTSASFAVRFPILLLGLLEHEILRWIVSCPQFQSPSKFHVKESEPRQCHSFFHAAHGCLIHSFIQFINADRLCLIVYSQSFVTHRSQGHGTQPNQWLV